MSNNYVLFDAAGSILSEYTGGSPEIQGTPYVEALAGSGGETHYVSLGDLTVLPRPEFPITHLAEASALGITPLTVYGIPIGATVTLGDLTAVTTDATDLELFFDIPGTYTLKVELFPYLTYEAEINAT